MKSEIDLLDSSYSWLRLFFTLIVATAGNAGMWIVILVLPEIQETEIIYLRSKERLFPGAARNLGASHAKYHWIAFIDSKTIPPFDWLKSLLDRAISSETDLVFGKTKYQAFTTFQFFVLVSVFLFLGST